MKNIILIQLDDDGTIQCQEITPEGKQYMLDTEEDNNYWTEPKSIYLDEIEDLLQKEV